MPRTFSYDLSLTETPPKAQARLRELVTQQILQTAEMSPAHDPTDSMAFRPHWAWPLLVAATRRIRGENINLAFRATDLGTSVAVTGKVSGRAEQVANREFWTNTLTPA
jgi:hypothetical protein